MKRWMRGIGVVLGMVALGGPGHSIAQTPGIEGELAGLLDAMLRQHPLLNAARAEWESARAQAEAAAQPVYNPTLELDSERTDIDMVSVGVSQTLDWHGRGASRRDAEALALRAAEAEFAAAANDATVATLRALAQFHTAQAQAQSATARVAIIKRSFTTAERRFAAGDIGQVELDLVQMELAEAEANTATAALDAEAARGQLRIVTGLDRATWPLLPEAVIGVSSAATSFVPPALRATRLRAEAARSRIKVAERQRRADPTIGLRVGQEESETLIGVNISLPLNLRNPLRAEVRVAAQNALAAEERARSAELEHTLRRQKVEQQLLAARTAWQRWQQSSDRRTDERLSRLERLWRSGELSTGDYVMQIQRYIDSQETGFVMRGRVWQAWIDWLAVSAQLEPIVVGGSP